MEIESIECQLDDEASWEGTVRCPACNGAWIEMRDGGGVVKNPTCSHLRFVIEPESDEIQCFNGFQVQELAASLRPLVMREREEEGQALSGGLTDAVLTAFLIGHRFDDDVWAAIQSPAVDTLFDYTESGMACGPVSMTAHVGARMRG